MLDNYVGLSDTWQMMNTTSPLPAGQGQPSAVGARSGVTRGVVYDTLGMPMSVAAAKAITTNHIEAALSRALAKLHHVPATSIDTTAAIDSLEVVFLIGRFYRELDRKQLDLGKVDRDQWSCLEGVASVLHDAMKGLT